MLKLRKGCRVPFPERLDEGYRMADGCILANVSADHIIAVMERFIRSHGEPLFFILELPAKQHEETELRPGIVGAFHKNVYYIDGCSQEEALAILNRIGELAVNDGLCAFGFGGHVSKEEILFGKYNVTTLLGPELSRFDGFFEECGIAENADLLTAWDTFSDDCPGRCDTVTTDGRDVYSIPEQLAGWGIYLAERREDS